MDVSNVLVYSNDFRVEYAECHVLIHSKKGSYS